jgi:hypothetical protein
MEKVLPFKDREYFNGMMSIDKDKSNGQRRIEEERDSRNQFPRNLCILYPKLAIPEKVSTLRHRVHQLSSTSLFPHF